MQRHFSITQHNNDDKYERSAYRARYLLGRDKTLPPPTPRVMRATSENKKVRKVSDGKIVKMFNQTSDKKREVVKDKETNNEYVKH